jgi:pimeloyl-ACP methyl ester carboxylesterase
MPEQEGAGDGPSSATAALRDGAKGRKRRWVAVLAAVALVAGVAWVVLNRDGPVGYFRSVAGRDRFMANYQRAMRQLPKPAATFDLRTSFGVVRMYRFRGANPSLPPLVLLPGRAAATPLWGDNLPSFLARRNVYTVDLLGEPGASVQGSPIRTHADQARWLHEALAGLPEKELHLLGVSGGGWTAMNLVVRHPAKVASLTLLDPVMTFSDLSFAAIVRSLPASVPWFPKSWRDGFNSWTAGGAPVKRVPVADMIESGMKEYALKLPGPSRFKREQLHGVRIPVLVIMAGRSVMHDSAEAAQVARETLPDGTVLVYEKASHAINGEYPRQIAADVDGFLRRTE